MKLFYKLNFKCIVDGNLGKIIKKVFLNQNKFCLENKYNLTPNIRYYVSSKYRPRIVISNLKYYGIASYLTDLEISDYDSWKKIKVGKMYRLRYYKHDKIKNYSSN